MGVHSTAFCNAEGACSPSPTLALPQTHICLCFWQELILQAGKLHPSLEGVKHWVVGGHSLGARTAVAVAAALDSSLQRQPGDDGSSLEDGVKRMQEAGHTVVGLVLSSYPVHPPGKPVSTLRHCGGCC